MSLNVFLNSILNRDKEISKKVLHFLKENNFDIILNDISIINVHYYVEKDYDFEIAKKHIKLFLEEYIIVSASLELLTKALDSDFKDFEDGVQYFCAKEYEADLIISNDKKGFKNSDIETIKSSDFYDKYIK